MWGKVVSWGQVTGDARLDLPTRGSGVFAVVMLEPSKLKPEIGMKAEFSTEEERSLEADVDSAYGGGG